MKMDFSLKLKKGLASIASVAVALTTLVVPAAGAANWYDSYVSALESAGVIDSSFDATEDTTRLGFVTALVKAAGLSESDNDAGFADVNNGYVNAAVEAGIVDGPKAEKDNKFFPSNNINRAEVTKVVLEAMAIDVDAYSSPSAPHGDVASDAWFADYVAAAYNLSIVDGVNGSTEEFNPAGNIVNAAMSKIVAYGVIVAEDPESFVRFDDGESAFSVFTAEEVEEQVVAIVGSGSEAEEEAEEEVEEETTEEEEEESTVVLSDGSLEVSLSASTPASATIPGNVSGAKVASFDFTANGDDVVLNTLEIRRGGLSNDDTLSRVALVVDGQRVSKSKTFTNDEDLATVTLNNGGYVIEAGETVTIDAVVTIPEDDAAGDRFNLQLVSADAIAANADTVVGDFPITSSTMEVASINAGGIVINRDGSVSNPQLGDEEEEVFKFKIEGDGNEDVALSAITFKANGTFDEDEDVSNYKLYQDNDLLATAASIRDDYLTFILDEEFIIDEGNTDKFEVRADIHSGAGDTLIFYIDSALDVVAVDQNYGFGAAVDITTNSVNSPSVYNSTTDTFSTLGFFGVVLEAGEVTIEAVDAEKDEIREDKDNVDLGKLVINTNGNENLELQDITITIAAAGANEVDDFFENIELYNENTGTVYDLSEPASATSMNYSDTDLGISLPAEGDLVLAIRGDTKADSAGARDFSAETFTVSLGAGNLVIEDVFDDVEVDDITPSSLTWKTVDGSESSATVTVLPLSSAKNAVIGSEDVLAISFEIEADESSSLSFDEITLDGQASSDTLDNQLVTEAKLFLDSVEGELLDSQGASNFSSETINFDGFDVQIPAGEKVEFVVTLSILDAPANAGDTIQLAIDSDGTNLRVELEDEDNDDVTVTGGTDLASARTITVTGVGTLAMVTDNTDSETDDAVNVLGNTTSPFVASYELTAQNEDVLVEELTVTADETDESVAFESAVKTVIIYADDKTTEIDRESVSSNVVNFDDIDFIVEEGSENIYIKVVTQRIGKDQTGSTADNGYELEVTITEAEGDESNEDVDVTSIDAIADTAVTPSLTFTVVPTRISNVEFVSSYSGTSVSTVLTDGVDNVLAIVAITTDASTNTDSSDGSSLRTALEVLEVEKQGVAVSDLTLTRISGADTNGILAGLYDVIDGGFDVDGDGDVDVDDDASDIVIGTEQFDIIDGAVDVDESGTVDGSDDATNLTVSGDQFDIVDGGVDIDESGTVDGSDDADFSDLASGTVNAYFDMTQLASDDDKIDNGKTVYFKVEAQPTLSPTDGESVKISLPNLDSTTANQGIDFTTDDSGTPVSITALNLGSDELDGTAVVEGN